MWDNEVYVVNFLLKLREIGRKKMFQEKPQLFRVTIGLASFLCSEFFKRLGIEICAAGNKHSVTGNKLTVKCMD